MKPTVRIVQRSVVTPAAAAPEESVYLTAVDIMCRKMPHNRRILFYKLEGGIEEYSRVVARLKESLALTLAHFYPLAGRLQEGPTADRLQLLCTDGGAELIEALVEGISFHQLQQLDFEHIQPLFMDLAPWIEPRDYCSAFPLSLQVSRFDCGSFALGLAHSHVVCDGNSLWHFMTSWAECARGEKISVPPVHTRTILKLDNPSPQEAVLHLHDVEDETTNDASEDKLKIFHFSKDKVSHLKEKAGGARSSYEAMCAHIWKHTSIARAHAPDKMVGFINVVNMRRRVKPSLPEGYFGNALLWTNCMARASEIEDEDPAMTTDRIHASIVSCDNLAFKQWLHWLEVYDRDEIFARCMLNGARLRASSSPKFPVFQVDFGWGGPIAIRCPSIELPGKIIFFPGDDGIGSIDVTLALPGSIMERLENDFAFLNP